MEIDSEHSLRPIYPDIRRTGGEGMYMQYDLRSDEGKSVWECKRLKAMSWNQAEKFLNKLSLLAPKGYKYYLLFKSNQQPCLVMYLVDKQIDEQQFVNVIRVEKFETFFSVPFKKHTPIKKVKRDG